jgi:uncharacterized protein (DUF1330 family)
MAAYVFINFDVVDAGRQAALVPRFQEALKAAGGRMVIMGGVVDTLEGDIAPYTRAGVLEFPTVEAAQAFYRSDDYAPIRAERAVAQRARMFIVSAG